MRSYEAARGLFSFLGICARAVIGIGVVAGFIGGTIASTGFRSGANELQVLLGAAPGALVSLAGFYGLALVQMGRTSVDTAEYAQQALEVSRQQLEISREALAQGKTAAASYEALLKRSPTPQTKPADNSSNADIGPSYGTRTTRAEPAARLPVGTEQTMTVDQKSNTPAQIENTPSIPTDDILSDGDPVTFKKGMWYVGDRTFQSEAPARNFAAEQKAKLSDG